MRHDDWPRPASHSRPMAGRPGPTRLGDMREHHPLARQRPDRGRLRPGPAPWRSPPGGFTVRLTLGAQLLALLTVLAGALVLPGVAPGLPAAAYLAATAALVIGFLASLIAHELAHAVVARRHGATAEEIR